MRYFEEEKPPLDELAHFGVKGMKWGVRKAASGSQIRQARREMQGYRTAHAVAKAQARRTPRGSAERKKAEAKVEQIERAFRKDPDRVTATRLTRGETAAVLIATGPIGLIPIVSSQIVSRRIQAKQESGAYNKKK